MSELINEARRQWTVIQNEQQVNENTATRVGKGGHAIIDAIEYATPYVGTNGNWWVGATDTGVPAKGETGRGIENAYVQNGNLFISYTDGTTANAGNVAGANGRGILSATVVNGYLWIKYTDGEEVNAGQVIDQTQIDDILNEISNLRIEFNASRLVKYEGTLNADLGGFITTPASELGFPNVEPVPYLTRVYDSLGTIGVVTYVNDSDGLTTITTISKSGIGTDANNRFLGVADTYANLPLTVSEAEGMWGITPTADDWARITSDENARQHTGTVNPPTTERPIVSIDESGNITWSSTFWLLNTSDYQEQSTPQMAGKGLSGGVNAGTFGDPFYITKSNKLNAILRKFNATTGEYSNSTVLSSQQESSEGIAELLSSISMQTLRGVQQFDAGEVADFNYIVETGIYNVITSTSSENRPPITFGGGSSWSTTVIAIQNKNMGGTNNYSQRVIQLFIKERGNSYPDISKGIYLRAGNKHPDAVSYTWSDWVQIGINTGNGGVATSVAEGNTTHFTSANVFGNIVQNNNNLAGIMHNCFVKTGLATGIIVYSQGDNNSQQIRVAVVNKATGATIAESEPTALVQGKNAIPFSAPANIDTEDVYLCMLMQAPGNNTVLCNTMTPPTAMGIYKYKACYDQNHFNNMANNAAERWSTNFSRQNSPVQFPFMQLY